MVVVIFGEEKADIFGFVGREAFLIDEDAGVEAVWFAFEDEGAVGLLIDLGMLANDFKTFVCDRGFGIVFFELDAEFIIKIIEVGVA